MRAQCADRGPRGALAATIAPLDPLAATIAHAATLHCARVLTNPGRCFLHTAAGRTSPATPAPARSGLMRRQVRRVRPAGSSWCSRRQGSCQGLVARARAACAPSETELGDVPGGAGRIDGPVAARMAGCEGVPFPFVFAEHEGADTTTAAKGSAAPPVAFRHWSTQCKGGAGPWNGPTARPRAQGHGGA